jgi:hypothetical protein
MLACLLFDPEDGGNVNCTFVGFRVLTAVVMKRCPLGYSAI